MKHVLEFFHDIIPVVFVVGIIAIAFIFYNHTKNQATSALEKTYTFDAELYNSDILIYDGMTISGTDVIRFARTYYGKGFNITISNVNTGKAIEGADVSDKVIGRDQYSCKVTTADDIIVTVEFKKK